MNRAPVAAGAVPAARGLMSWSGGKDSMLALHHAAASGVRVEALLTMLDETGQRSRSHALPPHLLQAQADALGLRLVTGRAGWADYEAVFTQRLRALAADGCTHAVFGDIDLQPHRDWEERVCAGAGLQPVLPLWQRPRRGLVDELFALGFRARVVCIDATKLAPSFCGRWFDPGFVADLPPGVDACGEGGEFHTIVVDGPGFAFPVAHELVALHDVRSTTPATGHHIVAELT